MATDVFLHAGAHRTGSSSFQMCLHLNADTLARSGFDLAYPARDGVPGGRLRLKLPRPRDDALGALQYARRARGAIEACQTGKPRLLLSDENIAGRMLHFHKGGFYPARRVRFAALRAALPGPVACVLLVIRSYDTLFASAWRHRALDHAMPGFGGLQSKYLTMSEGWCDLIADLQAELQPGELKVVDYDDRPESRRLLQALVPDLAAPLAEPAARLNVSPTDASLAAGQTWRGPPLRAPELTSFTPEIATILQARYRVDLDRIGAIKNVNLMQAAPV